VIPLLDFYSIDRFSCEALFLWNSILHFAPNTNSTAIVATTTTSSSHGMIAGLLV